MTSLFVILTLFGMACTGIEVSRSATVDHAVRPSGLPIGSLGESLSGLPHEGTSHGGRASRMVNETIQQRDIFDREWRLITVDDRPVQTGSGPRAHLRLVSDGRKVEGFTGCNSLQAHYESAGRSMSFVGLATTRKFCPGLMEQERAFLNGLERTRYWKLKDGGLVLMSEAREALLLFRAEGP